MGWSGAGGGCSQRRARGILYGTIKMTCFIFLYSSLLPPSYCWCLPIYSFVSTPPPPSLCFCLTRTHFTIYNGLPIKQFPPVLWPWLGRMTPHPLPPHVFSACSHMCEMVSPHCWIHFHQPPWLKASFQSNFCCGIWPAVQLLWHTNHFLIIQKAFLSCWGHFFPVNSCKTVFSDTFFFTAKTPLFLYYFLYPSRHLFTCVDREWCNVMQKVTSLTSSGPWNLSAPLFLKFKHIFRLCYVTLALTQPLT